MDMQKWYLQFILLLILIFNGVVCPNGELMCQYQGNDGMRGFLVNMAEDDQLDVYSDEEQHYLQHSTSCYNQERDGQSGAWIYRVTCDDIHPTYDSVLISYRQGPGMSDTGYKTVMCEKFHDDLPGTSVMPWIDTWPNLSCFRNSNKLVMVVVSAQKQMVSDVIIEMIIYRGSGENSERRATLIIVQIVVVIAAVLILVAFTV
ncbi:uncharacterized protein LOC135157291 isoform X2 [Lytechinus pictus]|uniref:uncharacterized protein LOC135157291 isoform X2 n=1 Tax=Lytechinus pictus TaxID=7653 RepID=UPI0030BA0714